MQTNEDNDADSTATNKNKKTMVKRKHKLTEYSKKKTVNKSSETAKPLNLSRVNSRIGQMLDYQIEQLKIEFKKSGKHQMLTEEELRNLYAELKRDRSCGRSFVDPKIREAMDAQIEKLKLEYKHYKFLTEREIQTICEEFKTDGRDRTYEDSLLFSSPSTFTGVTNKTICLYDQPFNAQTKTPKDSEDTVTNLYYETHGRYSTFKELPPFSSTSTFTGNINRNNCPYDQPFNNAQRLMPKYCEDTVTNSYYKTRSDYSPCKELPPFPSLSMFAGNTNENNCSYDQSFNAQTTMPKGTQNPVANSYYNIFDENQIDENLNHSLPKSTEMSQETNNETQDLYNDGTFFNVNDNSGTYTNWNTQSYNNLNASNEMQNFTRSNEKISTATENFACVFPEGYADYSYTNNNLFYNTGPNTLYENVYGTTEILHQNAMEHSTITVNENSDQSLNRVRSVYDHQTANAEENKENSFVPHILPLLDVNLEELINSNSFVPWDAYSAATYKHFNNSNVTVPNDMSLEAKTIVSSNVNTTSVTKSAFRI